MTKDKRTFGEMIDEMYDRHQHNLTARMVIDGWRSVVDDLGIADKHRLGPVDSFRFLTGAAGVFFGVAREVPGGSAIIAVALLLIFTPLFFMWRMIVALLGV